MSENNTSGSEPDHSSPDFGWSAADEARSSAVGSSAAGSSAAGNTAAGNTAFGASSGQGQSSFGGHSSDHGQYGDHRSGQPGYGQPGYGQSSYGQSPYGQGQYSQSSYGQGQPSYGQTQPGQPGAQPGTQPGRTQYTPYGTSGVNQSGMHYAPSPYVVAEQPRRGLSIASLVIGIASFVGFMVLFLPQIIGVVLGHIALSREPEGRGMAIAGLVLNYLSLLIMILFIVFVVVVGATMDPSEFSSPSPSFSTNA